MTFQVSGVKPDVQLSQVTSKIYGQVTDPEKDSQYWPKEEGTLVKENWQRKQKSHHNGEWKINS